MNKSFEESIKEIERKYTEKRKEIAERFQWEFNTEKNQKKMNHMINECNNSFKEELRHKKIEHLLNDTILRK